MSTQVQVDSDKGEFATPLVFALPDDNLETTWESKVVDGRPIYAKIYADGPVRVLRLTHFRPSRQQLSSEKVRITPHITPFAPFFSSFLLLYFSLSISLFSLFIFPSLSSRLFSP
jgi:hypothetical protein